MFKSFYNNYISGERNYGPSIDMWSVGCVFCELFIKTALIKVRITILYYIISLMFILHSQLHCINIFFLKVYLKKAMTLCKRVSHKNTLKYA